MRESSRSIWPSFLPSDIIFESFTFPFFDFNFDVDHVALAQSFLARPDQNPGRGARGLYVHIPYCDTICEFCPFNKVGTNEGSVQQYFDALLQEIDLVASTALLQSWMPSAVYIGGGTPSVLGAERGAKLVSVIKRAFRLTDDVEISFEVEPKSVTEELYAAIHQAGVNRVSFGVQTLDPDLRRIVNLTATPDDIGRTVELSLKYFTNTNMDMIVGYPGQSVDHAVADMDAAASFGIGSISLYPMDYITVLPKLLNKIRSGALPEPPSGEARWQMFHEARRALQRHYSVQNMYCFGQPTAPKCRYMFEILYGGYHDQCIGLGAGAYSVIRGLAYMNAPDIKDYIAAIGQGTLPIQRTSPGQAYEKSFVYMPKRLWADLQEASELGIEDQIMPKIEALEAADMIRRTGTRFELTERGGDHYAQIMVGFLSDNQRRLYERAAARLTAQLNWGLEGAIDGRRASVRSLGAANALPLQAAE